jgi:hypothetical protein
MDLEAQKKVTQHREIVPQRVCCGSSKLSAKCSFTREVVAGPITSNDHKAESEKLEVCVATKHSNDMVQTSQHPSNVEYVFRTNMTTVPVLLRFPYLEPKVADLRLSLGRCSP